MNQHQLDRLHLLEGKVEAIRGEMNQVLNQMADSIAGIVRVHSMFQKYVDVNLQELREAAGLTGKLLTDAPDTPQKKEGVEL